MAFRKVVADTKAYFAAIDASRVADGQPALGTLVEGGTRARSRNAQGAGTANRVVFTRAKALPLSPPRFIGEQQITNDEGVVTGVVPRHLGDASYQFAVSFWGYAPGVEPGGLEHDNVALTLFELTWQAVHRSLGAGGNYTWGAGEWTVAGDNPVHGSELVVPLTIAIPLSDATPTFKRPVHGQGAKPNTLGVPKESS